MTDQLTQTERNALRWVQLIEWWDGIRNDPTYSEQERATLLPYRIAILRGWDD